MHLIAWSIPVFIAAIALEHALARRRGRAVYRLPVAVADMSCGICQQLFNLLTAGVGVALYLLVYEHRALELDPRAALTWLFGMVAVDFIYYWWHRASHECNLLWAAHAVHHHSEDYNYAVALRQALLTTLPQHLFGLPLALLGLPPAVYLVSRALNSLYQFWIHTELIGELGPLEGVVNTPSAHRVHHAVNPEYLDRNYGGILMIWDRVFGSWAEERAAPVYGTTTRLRSLNPLWANVAYFGDIAARVRESARLRDKLRALIAHPAWRPGGPVAPLGPAELAERAARRYDPPVPRRRALYLLIQTALLVPLTMIALIAGPGWPRSLAALAVAAIILGTVALNGLGEQRRWAWPLEGARLALLAAALLALARIG